MFLINWVNRAFGERNEVVIGDRYWLGRAKAALVLFSRMILGQLSNLLASLSLTVN